MTRVTARHNGSQRVTNLAKTYINTVSLGHKADHKTQILMAGVAQDKSFAIFSRPANSSVRRNVCKRIVLVLDIRILFQGQTQACLMLEWQQLCCSRVGKAHYNRAVSQPCRSHVTAIPCLGLCGFRGDLSPRIFMQNNSKSQCLQADSVRHSRVAVVSQSCCNASVVQQPCRAAANSKFSCLYCRLSTYHSTIHSQ